MNELTTVKAVKAVQIGLLPFHVQICEYLKSHEAAIWNWFATHGSRHEQVDAVRFELLKTTYRVDRPAQPALYEAAERAAAALSLDVPLTIYQAQQPQGLNASIAALADEAHIVLDGPLAERLDEAELTALMAHELSHLLVWRNWDGQLLIASQVLAALTNDRHAAPPHFQTARLLGLYNEVLCDRAALSVVQDPLVVISMLVKVQTGLKEVSAASYLRQADEIFSQGAAKTQGLTHPEAFIRARAVKLWSDAAADVDEAVRQMIEGPLALDELDLLGQKRVAALTRRLVDALLQPAWMQSELVLGHARLFFDDYRPPPAEAADEALPEALRTEDAALRDYFCYVLLDFVSADRELCEPALAAAIALSDTSGLKPRFIELAQKELRLRKKQLQEIEQQRERLLEQARKETQPS
jgi:hypothetical protein